MRYRNNKLMTEDNAARVTNSNLISFFVRKETPSFASCRIFPI